MLDNVKIVVVCVLIDYWPGDDDRTKGRSSYMNVTMSIRPTNALTESNDIVQSDTSQPRMWDERE